MPAKNVVLTDHQSELIDRLVNSGSYQNASEVLRDGLRLPKCREADEQARLVALRAAATVALDEVAAGRFIEFDSRESLARHLSDRAATALGLQRAKAHKV